jgi:hypothetical protein
MGIAWAILQRALIFVVGTILGRGILLALNSKGYHPERWVAEVIGRVAWPKTAAPPWIISGLLGLLLVAAWDLGHVGERLGRVWPTDTAAKVLPGFGSYAYLRLYDTPELRRRFIYDFTTPEGGGIKFFLSSSGQFNFTVTDLNKETYSLEIPIGADGIPIDRSIFLFCEVGIAEDQTILRVSVDEKKVGERSLPFKIAIGNTSKIGRGSIGADANGQNNAPFKISEFAILSKTLTTEQKSKLIENFKEYLRAVGGG